MFFRGKRDIGENNVWLATLSRVTAEINVRKWRKQRVGIECGLCA